MKPNVLIWALALPMPLLAQQSVDSTAIQLQPVELKVYFAKQSLLSVTSSTQHISKQDIQKQQNNTLLTAINNVPGLRMEERSPGSYRLAMRGSLIRSPFGIRNTKIYMDEFPLTDAGGNTYLNLIDPNSIQAIQIIKGPDGSLFGANSGGIIRMQPNGFDNNTSNQIALQLSAGSFGLAQQQLSLQRKISENYQFSFDQSFTRSDGYRDHSALNKKTFQTAHQWQYAQAASLRLFAFYTDLGYQTPGGLNATQYAENPKASRPAAGQNPSAKEQQAAIYNKTLFAGLAHSYTITDNLEHHIALYASNTDFENPFITNYEFRKERNAGLRTYFAYQNQHAKMPWQMQLGFEGALGWNKIDNYDNNKGVQGDTQAKDNLDNSVYNLFYRAQVQPLPAWTLEASIGLNKNTIKYKQRYPSTQAESGKIPFQAEWMPRLATSYLLNQQIAIRASIAKGYSTPTLAEVRSSNNIINLDLQAEKGTNYETGIKWKSNNQRFIVDLAAYQYRMNNGIIRQLDDAGVEYYANAAKMNQKGLELSTWMQIPIASAFIRQLNYQAGLSYNHYRFEDYQVGNNDYSNHKMTAVPDWVWTNSMQILLPKTWTINLNYNFTSALPLDDANKVFADKYHLVQAKMSYALPIKANTLKFFVGVDNLLNEKYSLGNDINAFGGRFFNAAPTRNYYAGIQLLLK